MKVIDRIRSRRPASTDAPDTGAAPAGTLHIDADGGAVIDLRDPVPRDPSAVTTAMRCPNCDGALRVDGHDHVSNFASMQCTDCGFTFSHRVTG